MLSDASIPARGESCGGRQKAKYKSIRVAAISLLFPLFLPACGDFSFSGVNPAGAAVNGADASESGLKDQVNVSTLGTEADKQTDTSALQADTPSGPTEKRDLASDIVADQQSDGDAVVADSGNAAATTATDGSINSIETIIDDMALMNDLPLVGVNPAYGFSRGPGYNIMGNNPSGSNLPSWFLSSYPQAANTGYWKAIIPWFVLFEGEGNAAANVRIQMRNLRLFILSRSSNQWREIVAAQDVGGEFCPHGSNYHGCSGGDSKRSEGSGGISIKPMSGNDFHGWYGGRTAIDGADIKAVFVTLQSRLIQDDPNGADDRNQARYLFDVGADYYPEMGPSEFYLPGVGVSRAKLISNDWQSYNFMTFSDVGVQDPGGGITVQQLRDNPPPIE